jgi:hypothetical protein
VTVSIALDVVVAGLLIATIAYAVVLDRRIRQLRATRAEFETLVVGFNAATARAESAIGDLKTGTEAGSRELKPLIATARQVADDLEFLVERGNELADRLDVGISAARAAAPRATGRVHGRPAASAKPSPGLDRAQSLSREADEAGHALLKALRAVR